MPGKKWCEYCRINLPYNKKDIQQHEESRLHLQNKQKAIKFERIKIQQQEKQQRAQKQQTALLSTANIPKAKKGSALDQQVQEYRQGVIATGKAAIAQLIAAKTEGKFGAPIQYAEKQDLLLAENFRNQKQSEQEGDGSDSEEFQMWRIDICQETGDPCFINNLTKVKYFEPPKGYVMSEKQKQEWQYLKEICKEKVNVNADSVVQISEWEEVPEEQDYFKMNQIQEQEQQQQEQEQGKFKRPLSSLGPDPFTRRTKDKETQEIVPQRTWREQLEEKINNNSIDANQVMETVIAHKLNLCKNLKQKNETLKTLIKGDIEIRQTAEEFNKKEDFDDEGEKKVASFKPKKKVKTAKLTEESDIY